MRLFATRGRRTTYRKLRWPAILESSRNSSRSTTRQSGSWKSISQSIFPILRPCLQKGHNAKFIRVIEANWWSSQRLSIVIRGDTAAMMTRILVPGPYLPHLITIAQSMTIIMMTNTMKANGRTSRLVTVSVVTAAGALTSTSYPRKEFKL